MVEEARLESSYTSKAYQGFESPSLRKRPGDRLGCKRYSFATFLFFGGNEFIRSVSGSSVVRTADGRVLAGMCGSSVDYWKEGRNPSFVLSVGNWKKQRFYLFYSVIFRLKGGVPCGFIVIFVKLRFIKTNIIMTKICFFFVAASTFLTGCSDALQDGKAVVDRYYEVSGMGMENLAGRGYRMEVDVESMGMVKKSETIIGRCFNQAVVEKGARGDVKIVLNGESGWILTAVEEVQPIPRWLVARMHQQNDILCFAGWSTDIFDFTRLGTGQQDRGKYDVVQITVKNGKQNTAEGYVMDGYILYFDRETGLLAYFMGLYQSKWVIERYENCGAIIYPSIVKVYRNEKEISTIRIRSFEIDYPVTDEMFARPE